jgi:hypothetical protein
MADLADLKASFPMCIIWRRSARSAEQELEREVKNVSILVAAGVNREDCRKVLGAAGGGGKQGRLESLFA